MTTPSPTPTPTPSPVPHRGHPHTGRARRVRRLLPGVVLNAVVPLGVYLWLRPHVGGDVQALAIGTAVPVAVTLALFWWRRRIDPVGAVAVVAFGLALVITALSGGNALVLKLQDAVVTGPLGVACLVSVAVRRPLHHVVMRLLARRRPALEPMLRGPHHLRDSMVVTALLGAMTTLHAVALLVLATTQPTSRFLELSRPVGWTVLGAGAMALLTYRNRVRRRRNAAPPESAPARWTGGGR